MTGEAKSGLARLHLLQYASLELSMRQDLGAGPRGVVIKSTRRDLISHLAWPPMIHLSEVWVYFHSGILYYNITTCIDRFQYRLSLCCFIIRSQ